MKKLRYYIFIFVCICFGFTACEDLKFGDSFLQKPPSVDITIDTVFSKAEYARRVLWNSYQYLPWGLPTSDYNAAMCDGTFEAITDICHSIAWDGANKVYYPGLYNASLENSSGAVTSATKFRFYNYSYWTGIRHAWLFCENVDKVPDMTAAEKSRLKAEAKITIAVFYSTMLRHLGGLPLIDHSLGVEDAEFPKRATLQQTVDFIIGLLDDAINCEELPWTLTAEDQNTWYGRLTKASAMGLKVRVLLFVASPLFNNSEPYYPGEASTNLLTWFGDQKDERWNDVIKASEAFFKMNEQKGYYKLVQKEDVAKGTYRQAYQDAYLSRGTTESLIGVSRKHFLLGRSGNTYVRLHQITRWGASCPTKEFFDMFQMSDGSDFDWNNPKQAANPFINRDPRMYENILMDGDDFQGRKAAVYQEDPNDKINYPRGIDWGANQVDAGSINTTGIACRKYILDRAGEYDNRPFQWTLLRLAEIYLSYAEALNEYYKGPTTDAYRYVNEVRRRVGLNDLKSGLNQEQFREALLRERACEFAWEEVRLFDLIRWKHADIFSKRLHGINIYKHKDTGGYKFSTFELQKRAWQETDGFSPKNYLSAFPTAEINKGYGMIQNPGW